MRVRLIVLLTAVMLGAGYVAVASGRKSQRRLAKLAWSVHTYSSRGTSYSAPSCHKLGYFLGSPLRFDYGQALFQFKPDEFTYQSKTSLVGTVQGERVYQVLQRVYPNSEKASNEVIAMKRLVVERRVNHFCMIFQEEDVAKPSGVITQMKPATLEESASGPVLRTGDPLNGKGGDPIGTSWLFLRGVPVPLALPNSVVEQLVHPIVPRSCGIRPGDTTGTTGLIYRANVWKQSDSSENPTCGSVVMKLSVSQHKLVLVSMNYVP